MQTKKSKRKVPSPVKHTKKLFNFLEEEHHVFVEELHSRSLAASSLELGQPKPSNSPRQKSIYPTGEPVDEAEEVEIQLRTAMNTLNTLASRTQIPSHGWPIR